MSPSNAPARGPRPGGRGRSILGGLCLLSGTALLLINVVGLLDRNPPLREAARSVERAEGETDRAYAVRINALIHDRVPHRDPYGLRPPLARNWILWLHALARGYQEYGDPLQGLTWGKGFCSQRALIFDGLMDRAQTPARIVGLSGHVLNEAHLDGRWVLFDPSHNLVFDFGLEEAQRDAGRVREKYLAATSLETAEDIAAFFASAENNYTRDSVIGYDPLLAAAEAVSPWMIWLTPAGLILFGMMASGKRLKWRKPC